MTADNIEPHIAAQRDFGIAVCRRIGENIVKLGLPPQAEIKLPDFNAAEFSLVTDPFTQSRDLVGFWYNADRQRIGQIRFHGDGSFYAEYDVLQPHPHKHGWFVEAISAWGRQDNIKTEARLLALP